TRFSRDWSSDVCSSDLAQPAVLAGPRGDRHLALVAVAVSQVAAPGIGVEPDFPGDPGRHAGGGVERRQRQPGQAMLIAEKAVARSEERRVGKEWRGRRG